MGYDPAAFVSRKITRTYRDGFNIQPCLADGRIPGPLPLDGGESMMRPARKISILAI